MGFWSRVLKDDEEIDPGQRFGLTWRRLRQHPAPRYLVTGGLTLSVDVLSLELLHGVLGVGLVPATIGAFAVAFCVNFSLSRQWAFVASKSGLARRQLARYLALVAVNLVTTVIIVKGLVSVDVNYLLAKLIAAALNATGNFFAYRRWVFVGSRTSSHWPTNQ